MTVAKPFNQQTDSLLVKMADAGVRRAAEGLSRLLGEPFLAAEPTILCVNLHEVRSLLPGREREMAGIYLRSDNRLARQILMLMPAEQVEPLTGLALNGLNGHGGPGLRDSVLVEIGGLAGSFYLNVIADLTRGRACPAPPTVLYDRQQDILDILFTTWHGLSEMLLVIQSAFIQPERRLRIDFLVVPDVMILNALQEIAPVKDGSARGNGAHSAQTGAFG